MSALSVIIPAYQAAAYIAEAINSVIMQNRSDLEIIVVDDGSTDATSDTVKQMADRNPQLPITLHRKDVNEGGGATRNQCVKLARGEYIFNLDSDNILPPGLLSQLLDAERAYWEKNRRHTMVSPHILQYFADKQTPRPGEIQRLADKIFKQRWVYTNLERDFVLTSGFSPASSGNYLYHRSIFDHIGGYFEDCGSWDAWSFGAQAYVAGYLYTTIPETFYLHRLHPDSYWMRNADNRGKQLYFYKVLQHFKDVYTPETLEKLHPDRPDYPQDPFVEVKLREQAM